jgi:small subunit ribosomal protein S20
MPHPPSAKKRHRQSLVRRERNLTRRTAARSAVRAAREAISSGAQDEAEAAIRRAGSLLDRAARKGTLHPNNAARRKSRLARMLRSSRGGAAVEEAPKRRTRATRSKKT